MRRSIRCLRHAGPVGAFAAAILATLLLGCAVTQQADVGARAQPGSCAFLGDDVCAKLIPSEGVSAGGESVARLRYFDPSATWTQYRKVLISPVVFFGDDQTKLSAEDQARLVNFFHQKLEEQLSARFEVVQEPAQGVLGIQVALVDAESATPVMRSISMALPQARVLGGIRYLATGSYGWVGGATAEAKISDALSGRVIGAAVDKRIGGGALQTAAQWQWGDAENAMDHWAKQLADRLSSLSAGQPPPS